MYKQIKFLKIIANKKWGSDTHTLLLFYIIFIRSKLLYGCKIWGGTGTTHLKKLSLIQNSAMRLTLCVPKTSPIRTMEIELSVMPIEYYVQKWIWIQYLKLSTYRKFRMSIMYGERSMIKLYGLQQNEIPLTINNEYSKNPNCKWNPTMIMECPNSSLWITREVY